MKVPAVAFQDIEAVTIVFFSPVIMLSMNQMIFPVFTILLRVSQHSKATHFKASLGLKVAVMVTLDPALMISLSGVVYT